MNKETFDAFQRVKESLIAAMGGFGYPHYRQYSDSVLPATQDLDLIEKSLKALEIIKSIVKIVDYSDHTVKDGTLIILQGGEIKTKEEYDLLKEVLLWARKD